MEFNVPRWVYIVVFVLAFAVVWGIAVGYGVKSASGTGAAQSSVEVPQATQDELKHLKILLASVTSERDDLAAELRRIDPDNALLQ